MFDFKPAVITVLITALLLAAGFSSGCRRKHQDKAAQAPKGQVVKNLKSPERNAPSQAQPDFGKYNDQNAVVFAGKPEKETKIAQDINISEINAVAPQGPAAGEQPDPGSSEKESSSKSFDVNTFAEMNDVGEKYGFISRLAQESPELLPALIDKALDDEDPGIRSLAMDQVLNMSNGSDLIPVIEKAMSDPDPAIRQKAVDACAKINGPEASDLLSMALEDESEAVRAAALSQSAKQEMPQRLPVLEAGIASQYEDVRKAAAAELMNTPSIAAVDILLTGLNDPDPEFRNIVKSMLKSRFGQEFETFEQAQTWWDAKRGDFTDDVKPKDGPG